MKCTAVISLAAAVGFAWFSHSALAQTPTGPGTIADNDSIFIDGTTFRVIPGKAKAGVSSLVSTLGARELGPGAIVFRSGEKLYIVNTPLRLPNGDPAHPQNVFVNADKRQTNRVRVEYHPPKNAEHENIHGLLKARAALETMQKLFSPFRLPAELTIKTVGCDGMVNAWYEVQEGRPTITVCYEYVHVIVQHAPKETTPAGITREDAIVGQLVFLVAHEMGHALFELFKIPVFGREEDAADQVAAYFMLQLGKDHARGLIGGAAWAYMGYMKGFREDPKVAIPLWAFSSNHGSPEERFYNLLCIAYGANPQLFADIVDKQYLPATRARTCGYEYKTLAYAVRSEIGPHVDRQMATAIWQSNWLPESASHAASK